MTWDIPEQISTTRLSVFPNAGATHRTPVREIVIVLRPAVARPPRARFLRIPDPGQP
jgi:hypothetical protein